MRLLLDIGNTRIKWALQQTVAATGTFVAFDDVVRTADESLAMSELCTAVTETLTQHADAQLMDVAAVNVSGELFEGLLSATLMHEFGLSPTFFCSEREAFGLTNGYSVTSQLGVDRWAALVGALLPDGRGFCVVDAGTAITVDYVDGQLAHQGGLIIPGLDLMRRALFSGTGNIETFAQQTTVPESAALLGGTTDAAVRSGSVQAATGAVQRVLQSADRACRLVITGGDSQLLLPFLAEYQPEYRPLLVLEGLSRLAGEV